MTLFALKLDKITNEWEAFFIIRAFNRIMYGINNRQSYLCRTKDELTMKREIRKQRFHYLSLRSIQREFVSSMRLTKFQSSPATNIYIYMKSILQQQNGELIRSESTNKMEIIVLRQIKSYKRVDKQRN